MLTFALLLVVGGGATPTTRPTNDTTGVMARGVSKQLATRRANQITDVKYDLSLDLTRGDTAYGRVRISFVRKQPGDLILDFRGPRVVDVSANGTRIRNVENNGAHLRIPERLTGLNQAGGRNEVVIGFRSLIAAAGAPIIRFRDEVDRREYLYTLLVPSDAHALFPCFDQPDLKARLTLTLTVPSGWNAIGNGLAMSTERSEGRSVVHFNTTEPLPTYLFAFAAGPYTRFSGGARGALPTPLLVRASRAKEVEVDSLQNQVASALSSLSTYFGIRYPFQQFQYMLSPAFPFGGMEHPGVTMFNEELFIFREPPTQNQRLGRRATIYHEVAHQWFGDYVTMKWFDDLWLKEGFATYMAAKMQEQEKLPNPWMTFYLRNKPVAYDVDASAGTTPIWQELGNLDQAKSNYGAIVYNKAPSVLKQLNYLVGDSAFRVGVHDFLAARPYGNATWRDLLDAIGTASNRPLKDWGAQYILRAGMPLIDQELEVANGRIRRLRLVQRPAQRGLSGPGAWPIKTQVALVRAGTAATLIPVELTSETTEVRAAAGLPAPDFVFANAGDYAYTLVMLDSASTIWLESSIGTVSDVLLRAMLWGALWDLVRDARLSPQRFVEAAIRELPREREEQIIAGNLGRIRRSLDSYLTESQRLAVLPRVEQTLLAGAADASRPYGIRKNHFDTYVDVASTPDAIARLSAWLDSTTAAGMPLRQPSRWSIVTRLVGTGSLGAEERLRSEEQRDTTSGSKRRAFIAAAAQPNPEAKRALFTRYFSDPTLNEEWVTASLRSFNDPSQHALTLPYLIPALDTLPWIQRNRRIFFLGSWLGAFLSGQQTPESLAQVDHFLSSHPKMAEDLRRKILQSRDELERTVRIRRVFMGTGV